MKIFFLVLTLILSNSVFADDSPANGPAAPAILPIHYQLPPQKGFDEEARIKESVRSYLQQNPDCFSEHARICEIYVPHAESDDSVKCADGYTFISSGNLGFNIDRHDTIPKGMPRPTLEELMNTHHGRSRTGTFLGVCNRFK